MPQMITEKTSFIIPKNELTLTDQANMRKAAFNAGMARSVEKRVVTNTNELMIRGFQQITDVGAALEQWLTAALAVVGTAYSCFQAVPAPVLAVNKLLVFYKVQVETLPFPVSLLTFRTGGVAGSIIAEFDLEQLYELQEPIGYFSEPVVIEPNQTFSVQVTARIVAAASRVKFGTFLFEPKGQRISPVS